MASNHKITGADAEEILDSRGNPTLKVTIFAGENSGSFSVPSGASTGSYEALEKRDGDKNRFRGLGVKQAIKSFKSEVLKVLKNKDARKQKEIDNALIDLDGTPNKKRLGANAILGASIACAKTAAKSEGLETFEYLRTLAKIKPSRKIPYLYLNLINAGKHASSHIAFQEYMIVPLADNVEQALIQTDKIRNLLRKKAVKRYSPFSANYGDEGGFVIEAKKVREPLELLSQAIEESGLKNKVRLAIDSAASSFYGKGKYDVDGKSISGGELLDIYKKLIRDFDIISIEDPFFEDDFSGFAELLKAGKKTKIIGDDLTVTNPVRLKKAVENKSVNGIIIKPNQIGTLSETLEVMKIARGNKIDCIVSHRSGETSDNFIADLAYAFGAFGLKAGAPNRGERVAKYNRLWKITSS